MNHETNFDCRLCGEPLGTEDEQAQQVCLSCAPTEIEDIGCDEALDEIFNRKERRGSFSDYANDLDYDPENSNNNDDY